jgi:hypothetical protein
MKIEFISPTKLLFMNAAELRRLDRIFVIAPRNNHNEPLAVLVPYEFFKEMQSVIIKAYEAIESLNSEAQLELMKLKEKLNA